MRKLLDGGAQAVLGPVGSSHALAAVATTGPAKVIHASGGFTEELADGTKYPYHYQYTYNAGQQGDAVVALRARDAEAAQGRRPARGDRLRRIGCGLDGAQPEEARRRSGRASRSIRSMPPTSRSTSASCAPAGAEVLVLWNSAAQGMVLTAAALQSMRWFPPLLGGNGMYSNAVIDGADPEVLKNAYATLIRSMTYSGKEQPAARQLAT
jgi:hypothetical protein